MNKIRIAICGYGNLGKGVEKELAKNPDMELVGIFSRRPKEELGTTAEVFSMDDIEKYKEKIDVAIMCGGSANDLETQVPMFAKYYCTVDSFDTHAKIWQYYKKMEEVTLHTDKVSIISVGWDPGLFSLNRLYGKAFLPKGKDYTFWGKGVSQGHSNAIRRIPGVKNAVQYTIPKQESIDKVRRGENPDLTTRQKHLRECYVVAEDGADKEEIKHQIVTMPNYFDEYDTIVHWVSEEELKEHHSGMPHGGFVIRSGETGNGNKEIMEFSLNLESNPEFTASVLIAYARAAYKMNKDTYEGVYTIYHVPPFYLLPMSEEEMLRML